MQYIHNCHINFYLKGQFCLKSFIYPLKGEFLSREKEDVYCVWLSRDSEDIAAKTHNNITLTSSLGIFFITHVQSERSKDKYFMRVLKFKGEFFFYSSSFILNFKIEKKRL